VLGIHPFDEPLIHCGRISPSDLPSIASRLSNRGTSHPLVLKLTIQPRYVPFLADYLHPSPKLLSMFLTNSKKTPLHHSSQRVPIILCRSHSSIFELAKKACYASPVRVAIIPLLKPQSHRLQASSRSAFGPGR
jgi:hypothetical protein